MPTRGPCTSKISMEGTCLNVCWTRQPMVKCDPVDDLDTSMREFMEWEYVPRVLIEKTGYTIGDRSWTATALYSSM